MGPAISLWEGWNPRYAHPRPTQQEVATRRADAQAVVSCLSVTNTIVFLGARAKDSQTTAKRSL